MNLKQFSEVSEMTMPKRATWARDGRKKGPNIISFSVKSPATQAKKPAWDPELECTLRVPTPNMYNVRPAFARGWTNTAWDWGTVKVHLDDWTEPESDNRGNGYDGEMIVTVYKLKDGQWVQENDFIKYYDYDRRNITLGDIFRSLGLEPIVTEE